MKQITLKKIITIALEALVSFGLKEQVLRNYRGIYNRLSLFYASQNRTIYSVQLSETFAEKYKQRYEDGLCCKTYYGLNRRAVQILKDYYYNETIVWKVYSFSTKKILPTMPVFIKLQGAYVEYLASLGWKQSTIDSADFHTRDFLLFIEQQGYKTLTNITPTDVSQYFPHLIGRFQPTSMGHVVSNLRQFFSYIGKIGAADAIPLLNALPARCAKKHPVIPTFTKAEGEAILSAQEADSSCTRRDRAIIVLTSKTGLRSVDIINLKLSDIDWRNDSVSIVQAKTEEPLTIPLLPEVGNAVADYILHERPESKLPHIFLRSCAPFTQLTSHSACWRMSANAMKRAGVRQEKGARKGLHVIRHSFATNLLEEGVSLPIISSMLGHRSKESTNVYLSVDEVHLKECALGLDGIEVMREELQ